MKTRLKELRAAAGYATAAQFAEYMNLSVHTYRKYEQGVIDLPIETAFAFADVFDCTLDELVGRTPPSVEALTQDERALLDCYRRCDSRDKAAVAQLASTLSRDEVEEEEVEVA